MAPKGAMLKGAKSKFWRHFENILQAHQEQFPLLSYLAREMYAVPYLLPATSQNVCFLLLANRGAAWHRSRCERLNIKVSDSLSRNNCFFPVANNSPLHISFICENAENLVIVNCTAELMRSMDRRKWSRSGGKSYWNSISAQCFWQCLEKENVV